MRGNSNFGNKNRGNRQFGRGGYNRHGSQNRHFKQNSKPFIPHVLFDFIQVEHAFQRVRPISVDDDKALNDALVKRSQDLTPGSNETNQLLNTVTKIQTIVENLIASPVESYQIDEVKQVGSFKKGTILVSNRLTADIAIVLKTLPTREAVNALAQKVLEELKKAVSNPIEINNLHLSLNESGFEIFSASFVGSNAIDLVVQVLITTQYQNIRKLDPSLHLDSKQCQISLASVKHAKWFEEKVTIENIKILIRLLRDIRSRFDGLTPLNPWIIDLIAHYAVTNNPKHEPLSLVVAFKRIFQLISAGIFLPGSAGIIDPCEHAPTRVHTTMTLEQQDSVCFTFQTLFRVLSHGGFRQILGLEGNSSIATSPSVWAGIVIIPSSKAYEPSLDQQYDDKEDDLNKEDEQMISDENVKIDPQMNNSVE